MTHYKYSPKDIIDLLNDIISQGWLFFLNAKLIHEAFESKGIRSTYYFFIACHNACVNEAILVLTKLLDPRKKKDSITIFLLLNRAENSPDEFSFASRNDIINALKSDYQKLDNYKTLLDNLIVWRDKTIAHFDKTHLNKPIFISMPVNMVDVEKCYRDLFNIIDRYSIFYDNSAFYTPFFEEGITEDLAFLVSAINRKT